jgi:uncharacterized protein (DUF2237 family)
MTSLEFRFAFDHCLLSGNWRRIVPGSVKRREAVTDSTLTEEIQKNVLGEPLQSCSLSPLTGFYRNGCCETGAEDAGVHTVCVEMTAEFLEFSKSRGNDLSTPNPAFRFAGLKPGDRWCLCAARWKEALDAGVAPRVILQATHAETLQFATFSELKQYALDLS